MHLHTKEAAADHRDQAPVGQAPVDISGVVVDTSPLILERR